MVGQLITLPLRVWLRTTRLALHVAQDAAVRAASLANDVVKIVVPSDGASAQAPTTPQPEAPSSAEQPSPEPADSEPTQPAAESAPAAATAVAEAPAEVETPPRTETPEPPRVSEQPAPAFVPEEPEPVHVSEEPELVRESAEPGAEDGAGATVRIAEPWDGYDQMKAAEVTERLRQATQAELAAVKLYEMNNRNRQTVLAAVDRHARDANGSGARD